MLVMNEYSKAVFNDPKLLREKLMLFLDAPDKVEIYAQSCEKFFQAGGKRGLGFCATWSWWAFIATFWFSLYRKDYLNALGAFIVEIFLAPLVMVVMGICGKHFVVKRFVTLLNLENDTILTTSGGKNSWVLPVAIVLNILVVLLIIGEGL